MREAARRSGRAMLLLLVGLAVVTAGAATTDARPRIADGATARPSASPGESELETAAPASRRSLARPVAPPVVRQTREAPDPAPGQPGAVTPMDAAVPERLRIPSIGVDTPLMDLGLQPDGTLEVPPTGSPAGWYTGAPTPGELGPAIIAGHVDWDGRPGVFSELHDLASGDALAITRQDGSTARFRVTRVERSAKDAFPTEAVYGDIDHAGLRLITCGGDFDRRVRSYVDNVVVFAELVGSDPAQRPVASPSPSSSRTFSMAASTPAT